MTKNEKQQLATVARYIESGASLIESGRIHAGRESVEMARVLVEVMISLAAKRKT